jgi:hypothetical protein
LLSKVPRFASQLSISSALESRRLGTAAVTGSSPPRLAREELVMFDFFKACVYHFAFTFGEFWRSDWAENQPETVHPSPHSSVLMKPI